MSAQRTYIVSLLALVCIPAEAGEQQVEPAFVTNEDLREQFLIDIPEGWTTYDQSVVMTGKSQPTGLVLFTSVDLAGMEIMEQLETMSQLDTGEVPCFFVDRLPVKKKENCKEFSEKAAKEVVKMIKKDKMFKDSKTLLKPQAEAVTVAGCQGVRVVGETEKKEDGRIWRVEMRAVSDGEFLYLFTVRHLSEHFDASAEVFEKAMGTLQLAGVK